MNKVRFGETSGPVLRARDAAHLDRLLESATAALGSGAPETALRYVDRAWRHAPDNRMIAHLLASLLLRCGDFRGAARRFAELAERRPAADYEAGAIEALLGLGEIDAASRRLERALGRFAVAPQGLLAQAARRVMSARAEALCGWLGVAPDLTLVGEVRGAPGPVPLELCARHGEALHAAEIAIGADGLAGFRLPAVSVPSRHALCAVAAGASLIGSGLSYPPIFELDSRITAEGGRIAGWVSLVWSPDVALALSIKDGLGHRHPLDTAPDPAAPWRRRFDLDPRATALSGGEFAISALLPDGSQQALPDSPLLLTAERAAPPRRRLGRSLRQAAPAAIRRRGIDVIVPVYGGGAETLACLDAVIATTAGKAQLVVVDDASPEPELADALQRLAAAGSITLLRNERNCGFPASANRGLALNPDRDAVLLNSDTVVFGDWLDRLAAAAYSAADVGTVTPFSNSGSIASYPGGVDQACDATTAAAIDALAAGVNRAVTVELPVGVGFCQFFRRDCLAEIDLFDAKTFASGYGEEVDFCLRAGARGWRHVLAADVFVLHAGGRSFGARRKALLDRGTRLINRRYPAYPALIEAFHARNPLSSARRRLDEARLRQSPGRAALLLTLALSGGVARFVRERCRALREAGIRPLVLKPAEEPGRCLLSVGEDDAPGDLRYAIPAELPALLALLAELDLGEMELHHFLDLDPRLVDAVIGLSLPCRVYVHDYSWICPRLTLIDGEGGYCGEPELAACETCVAVNGSSLEPPIGVAALRERSAGWLARARQVIVPSRDAARRLRRYFPAIEPEVVPWEPDVARAPPPPAPPREQIRVAVIGAIGEHKGYGTLLACARDAAARGLPLEFVVIGYTRDDTELFETGNVFVTGRYEESEIQDLLRREAPNIVFIPSIVPETWCYALSHAIHSGLPTIGFDRGAIGERLSAAANGIVIPVATDAANLNHRLLEIGGEYRRNSLLPRLASPTADGLELAPRVVPESQARSALMPSISGISTTVRVVPVSEGLYSFTVQQATPVRAAELENLLLPAVHVGVGPGIASDLVQFIPGPRTEGAWLYESGDMLVAKVTGPAIILLTSLRGPKGETLAVDVKRLDPDSPGMSLDAPEKPRALRGPVAAEGEEPAAPLRVQVNMHIRNIGDTRFMGADWAGRSGRGKWVEAFAVLPLEQIAASDIEYK
ncbi:MAG TPA: glycosyltransferase, partial [Stellaceae bacterium]|nr:glycosyltransferase [Stellaceae bacterium]